MDPDVRCAPLTSLKSVCGVQRVGDGGMRPCIPTRDAPPSPLPPPLFLPLLHLSLLRCNIVKPPLTLLDECWTQMGIIV